MAGLLDSRRWELLGGDPSSERAIVEACGVVPIVARTLVSRGIRDVEEARLFLSPSIERDWLDPLLIPGMSEVADRVQAAIEGGETIAVFGDFDVDGMSATCLLTLGVRRLGGHVLPFIPDRFKEGYGLSRTSLERMLSGDRPDLIVTVDNGISARVEVDWLLSQGIDVVVTDHHEPAELVPEGVAVTDPKLEPDCPSRELAGAGVALKLLQVLGRRLGQPELWRRYTEIATLGTISDMMLLKGENRALVADGISRMRATDRPGIVELAATARTDLSRISSDSLPFSLIPRLNAAGRMGQTKVAFDLLMADDPLEARTLALRLEEINTSRRETESSLAAEALAQVESDYHGERVIVVAGKGWHEGVKGIVASRVTSRYHVPSLLFSIAEDGIARGSGRSVGTVDLFKAVERCSDLLVRFGGHSGAVGVTCEADKLDALRERLSEVMDELPQEQFESRGEVDALVSLSEMTVGNLDALDALQPFGQANKKPLFAACGVSMKNRGKVGVAGNHLRFVATDGQGSVAAIMFRVPQIDRAAACDEVVDLVFEPVNEAWQGRIKPKLMVKDIIYREEAPVEAAVSSLTEQIFASAQECLAASADVLGCGPVALACGVTLVADGSSVSLRDAALCANASGPQHAATASPGSLPPAVDRLANMPSGLSYEQLTDELRRRMIGSSALLPAQSETLARLARGRSCLCVMATGRGKSLIFHIHAAREAIAHGKASVFVYPLRALVADQAFHLGTVLGELGLDVRVLTGETPHEGREEAFSALASGKVSVLLTTPEFLAIHVDRFAVSGRIGFVVIDEAHHGDVTSARARDAYAGLPRVLDALGNPTALAVTATADSAAARQIATLLSIDEDDVIVDASVRENLHLIDLRESRDRSVALVSIVATGEKTVIYVNSRERSLGLARMLRKGVPDLGHRISFYNAGMPRELRRRVEDAFREGLLTTIVSTSAFGEGVNLPDVRNVVLYHMPFDAVEFNQMSGRAGRDGEDAAVWLLFGSRDAHINERVLASAAPQREIMAQLYVSIRDLCGDAGQTVADDSDIVARAHAAGSPWDFDEREVASAIATFSELGFIQVDGYGPSRRITMAVRPQHSSLERSSRYLAGLSQVDDFRTFRDWVLSSSQEELLERINRPMVPDFGTVVDRNGGLT